MSATSKICQYPNCDRDASDGRLCDQHLADRPVDHSQTSMFGDELTSWWDEWQGMPEYVSEDLEPTKTLYVHFESLADLAAFATLVDQKIAPTTRSIWFPEAKISSYVDKRYADANGDDATEEEPSLPPWLTRP